MGQNQTGAEQRQCLELPQRVSFGQALSCTGRGLTRVSGRAHSILEKSEMKLSSQLHQLDQISAPVPCALATEFKADALVELGRHSEAKEVRYETERLSASELTDV